MVMNHW